MANVLIARRWFERRLSMSGARAVWFGLLAVTALGWGTCALAQPANGAAEVDQRIVIEAVPGQMKYDKNAFSVKPGSTVELVLKNPDSMQHNLVMCVKGPPKLAIEISKQAWQMDDAVANQYVPDSAKVLAATELVDPESSTSIVFEVPEQQGDYPYVCTFPGHAYTMKGTMHVTADGEAPGGEQIKGSGPLKDLAFDYYEGSWSKLPRFDELTPKRSGKIKAGLVSLAPAQRGSHFALRFTGKLTVTEPGEYFFGLASDDGSKLWVDGELVIDNGGVHGVKRKVAKVRLTRGTHELKLGYFQGGGGKALALAWRPVEGEARLLSEASGPFGGGGPSVGEFVLEVSDRPRVVRAGMPQASPRALAVGLPGGVHGCFEVKGGYMRYGWQGAFVDVAPERGSGRGRGGKTIKVLGEQFDLGAARQPLRFGPKDEEVGYTFRGYRLTESGPVFMYRLNGTRVRQKVEPAGEGRVGFRYTYRLRPAPREAVYFAPGSAAVEVEAEVGQWSDGKLRVPAEQAKSFSVTVIHPDK
jgi:azurin